MNKLEEQRWEHSSGDFVGVSYILWIHPKRYISGEDSKSAKNDKLQNKKCSDSACTVCNDQAHIVVL
jgi:hypothetical protein